VTRPDRGTRPVSSATRWALISAVLAALLALVIWLVIVDAPVMRVLVRLYRDKHFLKETVAAWGWAAPVIFVAIQAAQVVFILEAEGAIICFILYLMPGFPKDIISYLFGISPMPFWLFALVSTLGRLPGTWISSYFGAHVAEQQYIYAIAFMALVVALCLPLYYYRDRIVRRFHPVRRKSVKELDGRRRRYVE
jgi:uncharacterized membrane protein YdjX (TVP38/TMEM64 family)